MDIEKDIKQCTTCKTIKESAPTPEGDEVCPNCGDKEMMDFEITCGYGCDFQEPYGFVPEAGCPVHD